MKKIHLIIGASLLMLSTACEKKTEPVVEPTEDTVVVEEETTTETDPMEADKVLELTFSPASDSNLSGTAVFTQNGDEVTLQVDLEGLTPGDHAIHVHEKGDCSAPDAKSAGGHWNPAGTEHGKFDVEAFHMGDIGNLTANEEGKASLTFSTDKWCLDCEDEMQNLMGRALIVHESADDFTSQPTGNAGGRIGCLVIE